MREPHERFEAFKRRAFDVKLVVSAISRVRAQPSLELAHTRFPLQEVRSQSRHT